MTVPIKQSFNNIRENEVIFTNVSIRSNQEFCYSRIRDADLVQIETVFFKNWYFSTTSLLKDVFLPRGYPETVSSDYLEYQIWDTLQAFCSSISNTLTIRAVMQGIGVGSEAANPASAAIAWLLKDGTGMLGSILFTWARGSKLDSDCKKWRLFADVLNDIAMFVELYIPYRVKYSKYLLCLATVMKAIVGTAGTSTRAALTSHQAITGNIADVSAKDRSQEICTSLCAFIVGIFLLNYVTEPEQVWSVMCTATLFHLYFNYKAVRCLKMKVFNRERFRLAMKSYFISAIVPKVEIINKKEPIFLLIGTNDHEICGFKVVFGECIKKALSVNLMKSNLLSSIIALFHEKRYFILLDAKEKKLYVTFRKKFLESDVLKSYFHSMLLGVAYSYLHSNKNLFVTTKCRKHSPVFRLRNTLNEFLAINSDINQSEEDRQLTLFLKSYMICEDIIEQEYTSFTDNAHDQGWSVEKHLINIGEFRGIWKLVEEKKENVLKRLTVLGHPYYQLNKPPLILIKPFFLEKVYFPPFKTAIEACVRLEQFNYLMRSQEPFKSNIVLNISVKYY